MMRDVAAIAKGHQVGKLIRAAEVARHQAVYICFTAATCDATGNALMIVAVEDDGANLLPAKLLRFRSVRDGYRLGADRTRDEKTNALNVHHQMFAAVGAVKGDVDHGGRTATGENG